MSVSRIAYSGGREVFEIGSPSRARLVIDRHSDALGIKLAPGWRVEGKRGRLPIDFRICPSELSLLDPVNPSLPTWHMVAGLQPRVSGDLFSKIMSCLEGLCERRPHLERETQQLDLPIDYRFLCNRLGALVDEDGSTGASSVQIMAAVLRSAAIYAAELCDPKLRRIACRFSPVMRPWLYGRLNDDRTGRLAQIAISCPGALVFAYALLEYRLTRLVGARLLADVIAGVRLNHLLRDAVSCWAFLAEGWEHEEGARFSSIWERMVNAGSSERLCVEEKQRLLVRRAGPRTSPSDVLTPPPLAFAPEDIPLAVFENARWFRVMSCPDLVSPYDYQDEGILADLSRFASRHSSVLHPPGQRVLYETCIGQLIHFVLMTRRRPSRNTCPHRLLAESRQWHRAIRHNEFPVVRDGKVDLGSSVVTLETPLPVPPGGVWSNDRVSVRPIETVGGLIEEGKRMQHCVGALAAAALAGDCFFYAIEVDGRPITVEIKRLSGGRLCIAEVSGFKNQKVWSDERLAMIPWLESIGFEFKIDGCEFNANNMRLMRLQRR